MEGLLVIAFDSYYTWDALRAERAHQLATVFQRITLRLL